MSRKYKDYLDKDPNPSYAKYQNKPLKLTKRQQFKQSAFWFFSVVLYLYSLYEVTLGHEHFLTRRLRYQSKTYFFLVVFTPFAIYGIFFLIRELFKLGTTKKNKSNKSDKKEY